MSVFFRSIILASSALIFFAPAVHVHAQALDPCSQYGDEGPCELDQACRWVGSCVSQEDVASCEQFRDQSSCDASVSEDGVRCAWLEEPEEGEERCVEATPGQLEEEARQTEAEERLKYELPQEAIDKLNILGVESVPVLIGRIIKIVMQIVGSIALLMFIYGGVLWMVDAGNSEKQKLAMKIIVWSSLGIVVILASYILVDFAFEAFR